MREGVELLFGQEVVLKYRSGKFGVCEACLYAKEGAELV